MRECDFYNNSMSDVTSTITPCASVTSLLTASREVSSAINLCSYVSFELIPLTAEFLYSLHERLRLLY